MTRGYEKDDTPNTLLLFVQTHRGIAMFTSIGLVNKCRHQRLNCTSVL
jgi:hypothetical protein